MKQLAARVAVVTGAGGGIGRAISRHLAEAGFDLALVDIAAEQLDETAAILAPYRRNLSTHIADVSDAERMFALPAEVVATHGAVHVLVNNAGVTGIGRFESESLEDLQWIVGINLWGVVHGCKAFLPVLRKADEAHIVNLSSMAALVGFPLTASYSMTKGAVRLFSESLRAELRDSNIGVTSVHPGAINTDIIQRARGANAQQLRDLSDSKWRKLIMRSPDAVARKVVRAIRQDRARMLVGPDAAIVDLMARLIPARSGFIARMTNRVLPSTPE